MCKLNAELKVEIRILKDEIAALKKSPKRPKIKANKKQKSSKNNFELCGPLPQRAGSQKKSKALKIHETKIIVPENLPEGSKLKRTRTYDVQDIVTKFSHEKQDTSCWIWF